MIIEDNIKKKYFGIFFVRKLNEIKTDKEIESCSIPSDPVILRIKLGLLVVLTEFNTFPFLCSYTPK
jgi:hypothetical protein